MYLHNLQLSLHNNPHNLLPPVPPPTRLRRTIHTDRDLGRPARTGHHAYRRHHGENIHEPHHGTYSRRPCCDWG